LGGRRWSGRYLAAIREGNPWNIILVPRAKAKQTIDLAKAASRLSASELAIGIPHRKKTIALGAALIDVETGAWIDADSHISGGIDSYYEYLWKCWLLFGDKDCYEMWQASISAINKYLTDEVGGELWYGHADMNTGRLTASQYGALDALRSCVAILYTKQGRIAMAITVDDMPQPLWSVDNPAYLLMSHLSLILVEGLQSSTNR
jgi:hypothetical protein